MTERPRPRIPVLPLGNAALLLGYADTAAGRRAAESALRHADIRSGYPRAAVEWLRDNRPGRGARTDLKDQAMDPIADRFAALVSIETRAAVDSLVEHEIVHEYEHKRQTGDPAARAAARKGARTLALAGIQMDWHNLFVEINGSDRGLPAAADMHLRTMVREGMDARVCQCPEDGIGDHRADGHGHRGKCENHFEADVPPVNGNKLCGNCYCAGPDPDFAPEESTTMPTRTWTLYADVPAATLQVMVRDYFPPNQLAPEASDGASAYVHAVGHVGKPPAWMRQMETDYPDRGITIE